MKLRSGLAPLAPLALLYGRILHAKNTAYDRGERAIRALEWPVISVGNLSLGGAGKTPVVIHLARLLRQAGFEVDALSRGYGRRNPHAILKVDPSAEADQFGDEPLLIARSAGVPVFVGADRYAAGVAAERMLAATPGPHVHLLDDGFQHRRLARAVDIVLLHRSDFTARLLPAGRLREPLAALRRADVVVLRQEDSACEAQARHYAREDALFWRVRRTLTVPRVTSPAVAFCAIAHPEEFFAGLRAAGAPLAATLSWRDHHRYRAADIARLRRSAERAGAGAFLTTAKDAVRLHPEWRAALEGVAPLGVAELRVAFDDEPRCTRELLELLRARAEPRSGWDAVPL